MLYCFNCKRVIFRPHWKKTKNNIPTHGYWTCKAAS